MTHRLECDGSIECGCQCRCHRRCLVEMRYAGACWRLLGHGGEHRSRWAVEYARERNRRAA